MSVETGNQELNRRAPGRGISTRPLFCQQTCLLPLTLVCSFAFLMYAGSPAYPATGDGAVSKTSTQIYVAPGQDINYTIAFSNGGPEDFAVVEVVDFFPAALDNATWTCVGTGGATCVPSGTDDINLEVPLPAGGQLDFDVVGTVDPGATGAIVNTAMILFKSGDTDLDQTNNTSTVIVTIVENLPAISPAGLLVLLVVTSVGLARASTRRRRLV